MNPIKSLMTFIRRRFSPAAIYEGASKSDRLRDNWHTSSRSAQAEDSRAWQELANRARYMVRNSGYAKKAVNNLAANTVGTGIVPKVVFPARVSPDSRRGREMVERVDRWFDTTECDSKGQHNFYGLQIMIMRTMVISGAALVIIRPRRTDTMAIPVQLEVVEPDFIDRGKSSGADERGHYIVEGLEHNRRNEVVAFWLFEEHPGQNYRVKRLVSRRVPAQYVCFIQDPDRPGGALAASWFAPVLNKIYDSHTYSNAQLVKQKVAACFAAFALWPESPDAKSVVNPPVETIEPGMFEVLPPGYDVKFTDPPSTEGYGEFMEVQLREIAAGLGVPYEVIANDYSKINFSAGRLSFNEFQRCIDHWRWNILKPQFLDKIEVWFLRYADPAGEARIDWTAPRRLMVDHTKEIPTYIEMIQAGLTSTSAVIRELGEDPEKVFAEIREEREAYSDVFDILRKAGSGSTSDNQPDGESSNARELGN